MTVIAVFFKKKEINKKSYITNNNAAKQSRKSPESLEEIDSSQIKGLFVSPTLKL